jgi:hypothetical protein
VGPGGPRFEAERVELTLSAGRLQVLGIYTFRNPGPRPWRGRIGYPILVGEGQQPPEQVVLDGKEKLPVRCRAPRRCAAVIPLSVPMGGFRTVQLRYEQKITGRRAAYLLTSARRWKRPLRRADFVVRVPADWKGVTLSYPPERETVQGSFRILRFSRRDFVPRKELVVTWVKSG